MPQLNRNIANVGTGFAAFLTPPGPEVIRFTVGQPDFATPLPVVEAAKQHWTVVRQHTQELKGLQKFVKR